MNRQTVQQAISEGAILRLERIYGTTTKTNAYLKTATSLENVPARVAESLVNQLDAKPAQYVAGRSIQEYVQHRPNGADIVAQRLYTMPTPKRQQEEW